jgi:prophage regulatory protein
MNRSDPPRPIAIIRLAELQRRFVPMSRISIWRKVRNKEFPAPIRLGARAIGWRVADIEAWLAGRGDTLR